MTHTLSSEGADASEDGTGRGTPIVATSYAIRTANTNSNGHGVSEEVAHTLDQAQGQCVATGFHMTQDPISSDEQVPRIGAKSTGNGVMYSIMPMNSGKDYKAREVDVAQPLMTAPTGGNQGGDYVVQPLALRGRDGGTELEAGKPGAPYNALRAGDGDGGSSRQSLIAVERHAETIVRRLTPLECERLQGYPDGWTDNGQADSARYRQLGNSVAVPCVEWIARRLDQHRQHRRGEKVTCTSRFGFSQRCIKPAGHQGMHASQHIEWSDREAATSTASITKTMRGRTE